ncbi:DNA polymerase I [Saccharibacter floricola]|uniref:DNA polymerase I n=1 Tax=Saccharibacter floricola DSM 15669 TaxID=1123227 RepID=A0ABQ0NZS7_9PROT|nr:DNA polymerase I [Saccharibacter floricola]GBQ07615.1 DNA polymerase I [Saccharibacter floricola DSM 15669]
MASETKHLVLVDGSGFIFRAFYAIPAMSSPDGVPVNAVYGFTNMLSRLLKDHEGQPIAVIFDAARKTFRNDIYPDYKAHRPPPPEDLRPQFDLIRKATEAFGVPAIELPGWEADDLLATYARLTVEQGGTCTIISSDKDLMQLVRPGVMLKDPLKQKPIGEAEVEKKFGVSPAQVVDVQALMGDATDNVPGVPGIGPKGAAQLVQEYGSLEAILDAAPSMKKSKRRENLIEYADLARISKQLVLLADQVAVPRPVEELHVHPTEGESLRHWLESMGFGSILQRMGFTRKARHPAAEPSQDNVEEDVASAPQAAFGPYETVMTTEALESWIAAARKAGAVAVDTETTGLNARTAELVGISLATEAGKACYIPLCHEGTLEAPVGQQLDVKAVLETLAPLMKDESVLKIFQNAKYDLTIFRQAGLREIAPVDDTMLLSYVQSAGAHGQGMDELSRRHLGHTPITYDEVTGKGRNRIAFTHVTLERATAYAAEDADVTLRLWQVLRASLPHQQAVALYEEMERPLISVLADMEEVGIGVDAEELRRLSDDFARRMREMESAIYDRAGREFNIGSPKQLGEILFDEMGLPGGKRTKTGAWGTDSSVLDGLAEKGHDLPTRILNWRQLAKLKSTYADALVKLMDTKTHRIHTTFQMAVTTTGRLSSNEPNLQNIPIRTEEGARIRQAFKAAKGRKIVSADYSQIELRLLAHVAQIEPLLEAFRLGQDIHARTASEVFGVPLEGMDALTRRRAKAINFGIIYGISAYGLARQLQVPQSEAKRYIEAYFERYPGILAYMEGVKEEARDQGYVLTPFGRRCYVPEIKAKQAARRSYAERQAINAPLQGGAADIIKKAMVRLAQVLPQSGLQARMMLQVHDELLFDVADEDAEKLAALVQQEMEQAATLDVALSVETGIGQSWSDAH